MSKKTISELRGYYHYYPVVPTIALVQTKEKLNGLSIAWNIGLSHSPPLFGISVSPKRYSHHLIEEADEFTANFLPSEKAFLFAAFGRISGRELNKFETFKVETLSSQRIKTPILKDAYAAYECRVVDRAKIGDHTLFIGEILLIHYEPEFFPEESPLDLTRCEPVLYLGKDLYAKGKAGYFVEKIGRKEIEKVIHLEL